MFQTLSRMFLMAAIALTTVVTAHAETTQADIDEYNAAADAHNARVARYAQAEAEFNDEAASYRHAAEYYNSLPEDQRTQFQRDRLERWYNYLTQRVTSLNAEWDYLEQRGTELNAWYDRL